MIQRIQTIYLLVAAILMAVTAFSPIINFQEGLTLFSYGVENSQGIVVFPTWGIVSMAGLSALLSLITIFLYKNRKKQNKMTLTALAVTLFYFVTAAVYMSSYMKGDCSLYVSVSYGIFLPIISSIALLLASKNIRKDEKLVKSLDRLR